MKRIAPSLKAIADVAVLLSGLLGAFAQTNQDPEFQRAIQAGGEGINQGRGIAVDGGGHLRAIPVEF